MFAEKGNIPLLVKVVAGLEPPGTATVCHVAPDVHMATCEVHDAQGVLRQISLTPAAFDPIQAVHVTFKYFFVSENDFGPLACPVQGRSAED